MPAADAFRRILVVCTRQIGDVLITTPLIDAAKRRWPDARVDVLGFAGTLGILRGNPQIDALIEVPAGTGWWGSLGLIRRLWRRYDLALITQGSDRAHLYGAVAARHRSGLIESRRTNAWWKRRLLDHAVAVDVDPTHAALEKLRLLEPWVASNDAAPVRVVAPPPAPLPDDVAARLEPRFIVIQVPTIVRYKQWPVAHCSALAQGLVDEGLQVLLTGGPSAADRSKTAQVLADVAAAEPDRVLDLAGRLDLNQMAALLRAAALYIGPDTSITHLAAASGVPVIAIYGPIDPRLWGPWPQGHAAHQPYEARASRQVRATVVLLQGDPACVPCNRQGCERHPGSRSECLETLAPQRVLAEARALLARAAGAAPVGAGRLDRVCP